MAYQAVFKRKEMKYLMSSEQNEKLMAILADEIVPDDFPTSAISNLYYDTPDFRLIRTSLQKPKYKEKLRLRCYKVPNATTQAFLEIKKKALGIVYKRRESLPYQRIGLDAEVIQEFGSRYVPVLRPSVVQGCRRLFCPYYLRPEYPLADHRSGSVRWYMGRTVARTWTEAHGDQNLQRYASLVGACSFRMQNISDQLFEIRKSISDDD